MSLNYSTKATLACTSFNSLASSTTTGVASSAVATTDTSNNIVDAIVQIKIASASFTPSATTNILVWVIGSMDGTYFAGAQGGSVEDFNDGDAVETIDVDGNNMNYLGAIHMHTASQDMCSKPFSIAAAFWGVMPAKWAIIIQNQTGSNLASSGHEVGYRYAYYN
jgi:hypothetical protein